MSKALLFDRFRMNGASPSRILDQDAHKAKSVEREITRLLNTRSPIDPCALPERRTIIHYGLPDFLHLSPQALRDTQTLAGMLSEAICAYEKRIELSEVTVESPRDTRDSLRAHIKGYVRTDRGNAFVSFPVQIAGSSKSNVELGR